MQPLSHEWLTWLRHWWKSTSSGSAGPMSRRLLVEPLEDRTGLSAAPAAPLPPPPHHLEQTALIVMQPVTDLRLTSHATVIESDTSEGGNDPVHGDGSYNWFNDSSFPNTLGDLGQPDGYTQNSHKNQPAEPLNNSHTEIVGTPQRPLLLARTAYDAVVRETSTREAPLQQSPVTDRYFQIQRTPVTQQTLEVQYEVKAYTSTGALARQQSAVFAAGSGLIEVTELPQPLRQSNIEIITLTLQAQRQYQVGQHPATLFLARSGQPCSESTLLRVCKETSSPEALSALVDMHRPNVLQTCYSVLGNLADAEDASQIVFMMFAQQHFKLHETVGRWLYSVARNVAISFLRSRSRRKRHELKAMKAEIAPLSETAELREELDQALLQLPAPLRQAVKLRYLDGWSQEETAAMLGCPRGTVAQRAARGLAALRRIMTPAEAQLN